MSNFRVGQKVVCINAKNTDVVVGGIYTIKEIMPLMTCVYIGKTIETTPITFNEITPRGLGWNPKDFRPAVEGTTKAGMAILKSILNDVNAGKVREIVDA